MTAGTSQRQPAQGFADSLREFTFRASDGWPLLASVAEAQQAHRPALVMLHAGGPDHHMLLPLAGRLARGRTIVLPDIRGYGRSHCADASRHRWAQYADDVLSLIDYLGFEQVDMLGVGLGATIAMRVAVAFPERISRNVLISVEDIEDDEDKEKEKEGLASFARRVREHGLAAGWEPILEYFPPIVGRMVRDAIPRSDAASIAAAASIGEDRSFRAPEELSHLTAPTLIIPGDDARHPRALAENLSRIMPSSKISEFSMNDDMVDAEDFAELLDHEILEFLAF